MRSAMMEAPLGDDVFREDPSVNELEDKAAAMFGMEAGLFCSSGTMTNQIGIKVHTQPGDEVICEFSSHIYQYEGGGIAFNSGASVQLPKGNRGLLTAHQIEEAVNADDVHKPVSRLVSLENTSNRGGGSCYDFGEIVEIKKICEDNSLALHLDGARLFNAIVAKGESPRQYGGTFDSISICLSKGLGCPVGSVLLGSKAFIAKARRYRKIFGGGMRQAGMLAAAGIYALDNHVDRLSEDHQKAKWLCDALQQHPLVSEVMPVETNIVIFHLKKAGSASEFVAKLKERNVLGYAFSKDSVRLVTHLDVSFPMIEKAIDVINQLH